MAISITETKALSRHFLAVCDERGLSEEQILELLPIKTFQSLTNWCLGACRMTNPNVLAVRGVLRKWGRSEDPSASVNAYFTMAQELSESQRWELAMLLLEGFRK